MTDQKPTSWRGAPWETGLEFLRGYVASNGGAHIPVDYETVEGFRLGRWVNTQRVWLRSGRLSQDRITRLDELGFVWEPKSAALRDRESRDHAMLQWLEDFISTHGHSDVPTNLVLEDGVQVGTWIKLVRRESVTSRIRPELESALAALGFDFAPNDSAFERGIQALRQYAIDVGTTHVPRSYIAPDGFNLGDWFANIKFKLRSGVLNEAKVSALLDLGVDGEHDPREVAWLNHLDSFRQWVAANGDPRVPRDHQTPDGVRLGQWLRVQRRWLYSERLKADRRSALSDVHPDWAAASEPRWDRSSAIAALKDAATMAYPLTIDSYSELRLSGLEAPSISVLYSIFGSWLKGCAAAGVEAGRSTVSWNTDHHSDQEVLDFVQLHFDSTDGAASEATYEAWARESGAPPLGVVLTRFTAWSRLVRLLSDDRP